MSVGGPAPVALVVVGLMVVTAPPPTGETGGAERAAREARRATIQRTIDALRAMPESEREAVYDYIYAAERNKCQAPLTSLKVGCLLEAARRNCGRYSGRERIQCRYVSDTVVANRLSAPMFLPLSLRYKLMNAHQNYREALRSALRRRYARLVTELYLVRPVPASASTEAVAEAVDGHCQRVSRRRSGLSWSHCVAAVAWFIGTSARREPGTK